MLISSFWTEILDLWKSNWIPWSNNFMLLPHSCNTKSLWRKQCTNSKTVSLLKAFHNITTVWD